jgi:hypothetical protein
LRADQACPEDYAAIRGRLTIGRGLFRLWLVASVLWLIGVGAAYRPEACRDVPDGCLAFLYEEATLDSVPKLLPLGQEGLWWDDLTQVQQRNARRVANSEPEPKPATEGTPEDYRRMREKRQVEMHPELQRFKLVPIKSLEPSEVQWEEDQAGYRRLLMSFMKGFLAVAFAIPLAVGCLGFLGARMGRWVWAGFTRIT